MARGIREVIMKRLAMVLVCGIVTTANAGGSVEQVTRDGSMGTGGPSRVISLSGDNWLLVTDPQNVGRDQKWWEKPRDDAKTTKVPWIIQDAFPGYHGLAWYWREFSALANPHRDGRFLLRFWQVDYKADVWLNGVAVGQHEGGESPFVLDVTGAIKPGETNLLAVRVLNPTNEPIDGIVLTETARRNKALPYGPGSAWNQGGIMDDVELLVAPALRVSDVFARADWKTGDVRIEATIQNAAKEAKCDVEFSIAPAASGETLVTDRVERRIPSGETHIEAHLKVKGHRLWELKEPFLYRLTVRVRGKGSDSFDEQSVRFGFRDFRFENGAFRLNGKRIFLKSSHTGNCTPIGLELPHDPDFLRRDLINSKFMGFNMIRFIAGVAKRYQLDLCDEIGLMVYEESYAGWCMGYSPKFDERYKESILGMVRRDRNHPSITIWGLLNETVEGPVFQHAAGFLPTFRPLDDTRLVLLNSGKFAAIEAGCVSNPGTTNWENLLDDLHPYRNVPHTADIIHALRTLSEKLPVFVSEYGIGSGSDLPRLVRLYEQAGKTEVEDAKFYRSCRDAFLKDWERWKLEEAFDRPEDFFAQSIARMGAQRLLGINALRSNPRVVGYSLTGTVDQGMCGEGLWTTFRELKPGTTDAVFDGFAPLRWCLFAEPVNVYRGASVRFEAVLANEDALTPGEYPVKLQVTGPEVNRVFEKTVTVKIPARTGGAEPPMAMPVFAEDVVVDGPAGKYRFSATFQSGAAAAGEVIEFYVDDPARMSSTGCEVALWGDDADLAKWLNGHGMRTRVFSANTSRATEVILACGTPPAPGGATAFRELLRRVACGSTVVFLSPQVFAQEKNNVAWLPLKNKGALAELPSWLYHKDEWSKRHPVFDGLPAPGLMDYTFYREIIPSLALVGQDPPQEAVAGGINVSCGYNSGLFVAVYPFGAGKFVLNTLKVRENLGKHPVAEHLLRNMLRYAAKDAGKSPAALPADFEEQLKAVGY
jgi:hypothetical protein